MPLQRMSNGELGVRAASNGGALSYAVHLTINSSSGDAAGSALAIKKLIPQIEASIVSALSRGTNRSLVSAVRGRLLPRDADPHRRRRLHREQPGLR